MAKDQILSIFELEDKLEEDLNCIGCCVGWIDQDLWKFLIYLGDKALLVLYDKNSGIQQEAFEYLQNNLDKTKFEDHNSIQLKYLAAHHRDSQFYKYDLNVFETSIKNKIKPCDLMRTIEFNLKQIDMLEEGDIVMFERGLYHHAALLVDTAHMICIHLSGEPDNPGDLKIASSSLLGLPTEKASVTEDHLIEIAGYCRLKKSNEIYDRKLSPKSKEEIVNEAKKRLGERGYSVTSKNCQHFVSVCRNGTATSPEIESVATGALYSMFFGTAAIVLAVASKFFVNSKKPIQAAKKTGNT